MSQHAIPRLAYFGPVLFSMGFRPFFLLAGLFAAFAVPLWLAVFSGMVTLAGPFDPVDWHIHEMLFGYAAAVIAGFLFTAVPNWTGRMPARGTPLALLAVLWLAGRLAVAGALGLGPVPVMITDSAFLLAIGAMIGIEIVAGRNWRNLKVLVPVTLYSAANIAFHLGALTGAGTEVPRRAGFAVILFLVMLIGGRIIPSFTRNWLAAQQVARMPVPVSRFDGISLTVAAAGLLLWVIRPEGAMSGMTLLAVTGLQLIRLSRWRGIAVRRSPLLLMLHLAYAALAIGLAVTGLAAFGLASPVAGYHLLGIGAIGGMTLAVMMRAAMGHTGRPLVAGRLLSLAFLLVLGAALVRVLAADTMGGLDLAAALWTAGFALFSLRVGPWLITQHAGRKRPSGAAR
ncbi:NnrS family protein [Thioclava atlantica]|uniref:NnrS family protein n=1 Tax=Thioclava atlantica TaxID=1317124 RepID=A0A085U0Q5_9RHOB|nr:NnrS family protein [Thioclava atlantica]KFE36552.1 NnrS family protein [Thioclava atlantica]